MISKSAIIHHNVILGKNVSIEDYCIIGAKFNGSQDEETFIGDNAYIRSHTVIYAGNKIGHNFQTGNKANIRELNHIGNNVSIGTNSVIEHHILIEDNVRIHSQVFIPEYCILREGCWIGPGTVITNARYPMHPEAKSKLKGAIIERHAKIGAACTLLPGVKIGENSLIGAASLVVADIEDQKIAFGQPASVRRSVDY